MAPSLGDALMPACLLGILAPSAALRVPAGLAELASVLALSLFFFSCGSQELAENVPPPVRILIDPGHGGYDPGAMRKIEGQWVREKQVALSISLNLAERFQKDSRFLVSLTRYGDSHLSLYRRSSMAHRERPDLFVSVHLNAAGSRHKQGIEIFVHSDYPMNSRGRRVRRYSPCDEDRTKKVLPLSPAEMRRQWNREASLAGHQIQKALREETGMRNIWLKKRDFFVLRCVPAPAVLMELGFLSNPKDAERIVEGRFREQLVNGIYRGILAYLEQRSSQSREASVSGAQGPEPG
ncbi:MAG: N-acetylmuramoyl-L-alanine amidase [Elusimicrobia bacterium]|nr:N-acetylmuramoyl-L-alanine amidase [Elusimicrobiota bacterium]